MTELVRALGASTGNDLLEPADDNPHGFFENRVVKQLNDLVLGRLDGTWDRPPIGLSQQWADSTGLDRVRQSAETAINHLFDEVGDASACVIKDPRFSLTLPFWNSVMAIDTTVVPLRSPHEVAQSLRHRNGFAPPRSAELWLRYTVDALLHAPNPLVVPMHDIVSDPGNAIPRLAAAISLDATVDEALELAGQRERNWRPSEPFASVSD
ncbi:MAG: hypothetical protein WBV89_17165, partial [Ilumatobacter sp.]